MSDSVVERLAQLEEAVRRAADTIGRLREENGLLKREARRLADERKDRKSTRLNSSHFVPSRMPSSA